MLFMKLCWRCGGDVTLGSYENDEDDDVVVVYELYCVQCANTRFDKASVLVALYKSLETKFKKETGVV